MEATMKQNRLVPWFGSDAMMAELYARPLDGCSWVGVPFAGGMSIVPKLKARSIVVNDIHWQVINLATVAAHPILGPKFYRHLRRVIFHPQKFSDAQSLCELRDFYGPPEFIPSLDHAIDYFIATWMGRSGMAGKRKEFDGNLAIRWSASGGDSAVRVHSAVNSLPAWRRTMRRCSFTCFDFRPWFAECKDIDENGYYVDSPWVVEGKEYKHPFIEQDHRDLAGYLNAMHKARVVVRYGDHPLLRELYPADRWDWTEAESRTAGNNPKAEVMLVAKR